jgi:hypothetical protein
MAAGSEFEVAASEGGYFETINWMHQLAQSIVCVVRLVPVLLFVVVVLLAYGAGSTTTGRGEGSLREQMRCTSLDDGQAHPRLGRYYATRRFRRSRPLRTAVLAPRLLGHRPAEPASVGRAPIDQAHKPDEFADEEQVVACLESSDRTRGCVRWA